MNPLQHLAPSISVQLGGPCRSISVHNQPQSSGTLFQWGLEIKLFISLLHTSSSLQKRAAPSRRCLKLRAKCCQPWKSFQVADCFYRLFFSPCLQILLTALSGQDNFSALLTPARQLSAAEAGSSPFSPTECSRSCYLITSVVVFCSSAAGLKVSPDGGLVCAAWALHSPGPDHSQPWELCGTQPGGKDCKDAISSKHPGRSSLQ